jgi:hypothetical protein
MGFRVLPLRPSPIRRKLHPKRLDITIHLTFFGDFALETNKPHYEQPVIEFVATNFSPSDEVWFLSNRHTILLDDTARMSISDRLCDQ